ncbi:hypothetical protein PVAND_000266 [Polypedilum vanderplanki]|uniref:Uncharacterized protein n=1 Tax=Polypedilum vanderplanki TaxID=319348 RepID=A0A9J6BJB3_POLVA|nr:hypothetical protein PVAND_000266 [Polypedilum vanderplanki]
MMLRVKNFLCCMPLAVGALIIGYLSYALFIILGIILIYSGVCNIMENSIAFGIIIIAAGIVIACGYTAGSYLLIKGTRQRDFKKIQWYTIFILIALAVTVFILIFTCTVREQNKITVIIITSILSVIFLYSFIIVFSLQQMLKEEEEAS